MQIFFIEETQGDIIDLPEEESRHISKVLRFHVGDRVKLTDGTGTLYEATINQIDNKRVVVKIDNRIEEYEKRDYYLHLIIAPTKSIDRFEWFVEKATEIGVDEITPIIADHSERKKLRIDRTEKVIIAAMKQSLKAYKPRFNPMIKFAEFLENFNFTGERYIATCLDKPKENIEKIYNAGQDVSVLIGPEGDFTTEELNMAINKGFRIISLGNSRLRTETAGVVACYSIHLLNHNI